MSDQQGSQTTKKDDGKTIIGGRATFHMISLLQGCSKDIAREVFQRRSFPKPKSLPAQ
jgi:hypothetical protein